jgi:hypothetical protein
MLAADRKGRLVPAGKCALVVLAVASAALTAPASMQAQAPPAAHALVIVAPESLKLTTGGSPKMAKKTVVVRNDGTAVSTVSFAAVGGAGKSITVTSDSASIAADTAKPFALTFNPTDASAEFDGVLVVTAPNTAPGTVALTLGPAKGAPGWLYLVIFLPLVGGLLLITFRWGTFHAANRRCRLRDRVGPANWDFSKSWGSNLTVIGALLGTILSAGALPDETATAKETYAGLNLLFGVLIVVAPLLYTATQTPNVVHRTKTLKEPQYEGYVLSFLIASAVTLWATIGELTTVVLLFREIQTGRSLPDAAVALMAVLAVVAGALLVYYAYRTLGWILGRQCDVATLKHEKHAELSTRKRASTTHEGVSARREEEPDEYRVPPLDELVPAKPEWSML